MRKCVFEKYANRGLNTINTRASMHSLHIRQCMTKPALSLVQTAKNQNSLHIHPVLSVFTDLMCLIQLLGYPTRDKWEPLPYWVDVQADLSLNWSHGSYCNFCHALAHIKHNEE